MKYFCNYDVVKKDGTIIEHRTKACFSGNYHIINTYNKFIIYIAKNKQPEEYDYLKHLTEEELIQYVSYLNKMQMKCSLTKDVIFSANKSAIYIPGAGYKDGAKFNVFGYSVTIHCTENSKFVNLLLVNAIRFTYEEDMWKVVKLFLRFCNEKSNISYFNRFILALKGVGEVDNNNHYPVSYHTFPELITGEKFKIGVLENNNATSAMGGWKYSKRVTETKFKDFYTFTQDKKKTLIETFKKYKSLYA